MLERVEVLLALLLEASEVGLSVDCTDEPLVGGVVNDDVVVPDGTDVPDITVVPVDTVVLDGADESDGTVVADPTVVLDGDDVPGGADVPEDAVALKGTVVLDDAEPDKVDVPDGIDVPDGVVVPGGDTGVLEGSVVPAGADRLDDAVTLEGAHDPPVELLATTDEVAEASLDQVTGPLWTLEDVVPLKLAEGTNDDVAGLAGVVDKLFE